MPAQESAAKSAVPTTTSAKASEKDSNPLEAYVFELIQTKIAFEAAGTGYRDDLFQKLHPGSVATHRLRSSCASLGSRADESGLRQTAIIRLLTRYFLYLLSLRKT